MPYRLNAFGVLPPLWSSAAMKPLADLTFFVLLRIHSGLHRGVRNPSHILRARRAFRDRSGGTRPTFVHANDRRVGGCRCRATRARWSTLPTSALTSGLCLRWVGSGRITARAQRLRYVLHRRWQGRSLCTRTFHNRLSRPALLCRQSTRPPAMAGLDAPGTLKSCR